MPGNGGMRPCHSRRSVPVLIPLQSMSTTTSASPGGVRSSARTDRLSGLLNTTAKACIPGISYRARRGMASSLCVILD